MNLLDIILLALFIPGLIHGISKGLLEQGISIVGLVVGIYLAYTYMAPAADWIKPYLNVPQTVLNIIAFASILLLTSLLAFLLAKVITKLVEMAALGWLNKALGIVFSLVLSAAVISLLILLFEGLNAKFGLVNDHLIKQSVLYGPLKSFGETLFPYLKELFTLRQ